MTNERARPDEVGPVIQADLLGRAIVQAICDLNPEARIIDQGSYLRVLAPQKCRLTVDAVRLRTGQPFRLPVDLEAVMPSFRGRISFSENETLWEVRSS